MINEFEGKLAIHQYNIMYKNCFKLSNWLPIKLPAYVVGDESKCKAVTL